ncbi:oligosaccharide flippase family protein [Sphingobium sp. CAP-1]|uniref:oligosaccharide flippase family protein n=1 Tax=Sphingobium sp. CAP-1 TaxID=2676077 RepID=UPI0012BB2F5F|nr:oligosaccharide flippase family protein [Sphingobium sp. CAP-1]QGP78208.1 oligosaccharide flippase family protein [Sphingobium sp. CAP-1]
MKIFFAGTLMAQICALLRYVVLARILGPDQLGLAAILILTSQFFDLLTEGGITYYLIQSRDGDDPRVQSMVQLVNILRCAFMSVALLLIAPWVADFYDRPELVEGVRLLAIAPLILGFMHYDYRRLQRENRFAPEGWVLMCSELLSLTGSAIAAFLLRDATAVAYGLATRSLVVVLVSHLVADRRYAIGFVRESWVALGKFSGPLVLNGLLLFICMQGDRLFIGKLLGATALGHYAAILLLIYYPTGMLTRFINALHMPAIAKERDHPGLRDKRVDLLAGNYLLLGIAMMIGFAAFVPFAVPLLYGAAFAQSAYIIAMIGFLQIARFLRGWPTAFALAMGRSDQVLTNNIIRLIAFPAAFAGHYLLTGLVGILIGFTVGEILAFVVATFMVDRSSGRRTGGDMVQILAFILCGAAVSLGGMAFDRGAYGESAAAVIVALAAAGWIAFRQRAAVEQAIEILRNMLRRLTRRSIALKGS